MNTQKVKMNFNNGIEIHLIEYKIPIHVCEGQKSFKVNGGHNVKPLKQPMK